MKLNKSELNMVNNNKFRFKKIVLLLGIITLSLLFFGCTQAPTDTTADLAAVSNGEVETMKINLSELSEEAQFFEYEFEGKKIKFFAVRASDGSIKTAFDACDVCFNEHKGYRQEGVFMVCNNCGNKYPIVSLGTENKRGGGCWPGYLPSKVIGDELVIQKSDIESGKGRF
ncbi:MAG: DUF2318 domain-containing protein [archaeon]|jgi:uncharacterized membrane protein